MAKLELQNLYKQYKDEKGKVVTPVNNISMEVEDGEFLTLLGPSGCGKSTLLRLIAGLEMPDRGKVVIGGEDKTNMTPGDRNIAMVFQSYALYPHMSAAENIATGLKLRKTPKDEMISLVKEVANKLDLGKRLLDLKPGNLSGGQRQRVALARALVRNPDVFLLDEPLSNLDALLREQVRAELNSLFKSQNKPVVYVTHDQTEAMTLSSKVAVLKDGVVQQLDPPSRIYTHPANDFVAGFVGSPQMNLLTLNCQGNTAVLGDHKIPLSLATVPSQVKLGIRPEDIRLAQREDEETIQGKVYLVEQLGKENLISVIVEGSDKIIRALFPTDRNWEGETVSLAISENGMHLFDVKSGLRLNSDR